MSVASSRLFQPINIGGNTLQHRVVLAPLTRIKATNSTPNVPLMKEYYSQRSNVPGSLLITEGSFVAAKAGGFPNVPGIWNNEQARAWKEVTDKVHANGSYIFMQIAGLGRKADAATLASQDPTFSVVAPSSIPLSSQPTQVPRELSVEEIREYVQLFGAAAKNAVYNAGFNGVEIHAGNGLLIDQFIQNSSNHRKDIYGGSIAARSRFALEVVDAVVNAVGEDKTAIRFSPWSTFNDMAIENPIPQFSHLVSTLKEKHPKLAYIHVVEPRIYGDVDLPTGAHVDESNDFIRAIWTPLPLIVAGGYTRGTALKVAEEHGNLVAFGRLYISNPDLPLRIKENIPFTPYNRKTFYVPGDLPGTEVGYIDYPFSGASKHHKVTSVGLARRLEG